MRAKHAPQQGDLITTLLPHGFQRVAVAQEHCHQTGEQIRQLIALAML